MLDFVHSFDHVSIVVFQLDLRSFELFDLGNNQSTSTVSSDLVSGLINHTCCLTCQIFENKMARAHLSEFMLDCWFQKQISQNEYHYHSSFNPFIGSNIHFIFRLENHTRCTYNNFCMCLKYLSFAVHRSFQIVS